MQWLILLQEACPALLDPLLAIVNGYAPYGLHVCDLVAEKRLRPETNKYAISMGWKKIDEHWTFTRGDGKQINTNTRGEHIRASLCRVHNTNHRLSFHFTSAQGVSALIILDWEKLTSKEVVLKSNYDDITWEESPKKDKYLIQTYRYELGDKHYYEIDAANGKLLGPPTTFNSRWMCMYWPDLSVKFYDQDHSYPIKRITFYEHNGRILCKAAYMIGLQVPRTEVDGIEVAIDKFKLADYVSYSLKVNKMFGAIKEAWETSSDLIVL